MDKKILINRILLLLFIIPLFVVLAFNFGIRLGASLNDSDSIYVIPETVTSVLGLIIYIKLWFIVKGKYSSIPIIIWWLLMIGLFSIVPIFFWING